jgi:hypothetical protein
MSVESSYVTRRPHILAVVLAVAGLAAFLAAFLIALLLSANYQPPSDGSDLGMGKMITFLTYIIVGWVIAGVVSLTSFILSVRQLFGPHKCWAWCGIIVSCLGPLVAFCITVALDYLS